MKHVTLSCRLLYIRPCIPFHRTQMRYFSTDKTDPAKPSGAVEPTEPAAPAEPTHHSPVDNSGSSPAEPSNQSPGGESIKPSPVEGTKPSLFDQNKQSTKVEPVKPFSSLETELHPASKVKVDRDIGNGGIRSAILVHRQNIYRTRIYRTHIYRTHI